MNCVNEWTNSLKDHLTPTIDECPRKTSTGSRLGLALEYALTSLSDLLVPESSLEQRTYQWQTVISSDAPRM